MKYRHLSFTFFFIICCSSLLFAGELFALECNDPTTQTDMNACSAKEARKAEDELNSIYKSLWKEMDSKHREKLKVVEQLWLKYREKECAFEAEDEIGGSIYPLELNSCYEKITKIRIGELHEINSNH